METTTATLKIRGGASGDDTPYSFSLTTFSPQGSLAQIEYALNAAAVSSDVFVRVQMQRLFDLTLLKDSA